LYLKSLYSGHANDIARQTLTNKNQDLAKNKKRVNHNGEFIKLLDALKAYGPRNLSLISILTGIPRETVRYKVKKQLRDFGFTVQMMPNFYKLGLTRLYAKISFTRHGMKIAQKLLHELGIGSYLSYYCKVAFKNDYIAIINPPSKWANKFSEFFERLASEGIAKDYEVQEIKEVGYPHVSYRLFNFEKGTWSLNEEESRTSEGVVLQRASRDEATNYLMDSSDLAIITELQADAFKPLTKISEIVNRDPRLLRYHFQEHVVRKGLIAGYVLSWFPRGVDAPHLSRIWLKTDPLTTQKAIEFSRITSTSPFCKFYQILEDGTGMVYMLIDRQFTSAVRHLSKLLMEHDIGCESMIVDDATAFSLTMEMYKEGYGWLKPKLDDTITMTLHELARQ